MKRRPLFFLVLSSAAIWLVASCAAAKGGYSYRVKAGDTLAKVAARHGQSEAALRQANGLSPETQLRPGQILYIPDHSGAPAGAVVSKVRPESPKPGVAARPQSPGGRGAVKSARVKPPRVRLAWPVDGKVVRPFSLEKDRRVKGVELTAPPGAPVLAAESGTVIYSGAEVEGYEELVIVRHSGNLSTIYAWLSDRAVKKGDKVRRGQLLGHLGRQHQGKEALFHFETRQGTVPFDPQTVLPR